MALSDQSRDSEVLREATRRRGEWGCLIYRKASGRLVLYSHDPADNRTADCFLVFRDPGDVRLPFRFPAAEFSWSQDPSAVSGECNAPLSARVLIRSNGREYSVQCSGAELYTPGAHPHPACTSLKDWPPFPMANLPQAKGLDALEGGIVRWFLLSASLSHCGLLVSGLPPGDAFVLLSGVRYLHLVDGSQEARWRLASDEESFHLLPCLPPEIQRRPVSGRLLVVQSAEHRSTIWAGGIGVRWVSPSELQKLDYDGPVWQGGPPLAKL